MADPKKGTGKKPKGSGRRLYTDETLEIQYVLSLQLLLMQEQQWQRLKKLVNLMLEKYKY